MTAVPDHDSMHDALDFINRIHGDEDRGTAILAFITPGSDVTMHDGVPLDRDWRPIAARSLRKHAADNCYLAVALYAVPPEKGKGTPKRTTAMIGHCRWLYCERDDALLPDDVPPPTLTVETSAGNFHDWWQLDAPIDAATATTYVRRIARAVGVDHAKDAARVLRIPGTVNRKPERQGFVVRVVHDSGAVYPLSAFDHLPAVPEPRQLHIVSPPRGARRDPTDLTRQACDRVAQGQGRNTTGYWLACRFYENGYSAAAAARFGLAEYVPNVPAWNAEGVVDPYREEEYRHSVASAYARLSAETSATSTNGRADPEPPEGHDRPPPDPDDPSPRGKRMRTDLGNAERLIDRYGRDLRHCHAWGKWLIWDGTRWKRDEAGRINRLAAQTVRGIYREASAAATAEERRALSGHATRSEAAARVEAMVSMARSLPGIAVTPDDLDRDQWRLTVENGTLDLRTGILHPTDPADLITKLVPVRFDRAAAYPTFAAFLARVLPAPETRAFLQRFVGYSLTGVTHEDCLVILWGAGRNGKTTLIELLHAMLGDYGVETAAETLMTKRDGSIPNDLAALRGARFVAASEGNAGHRLAEATIKAMTGSQRIRTRFLFQEWFTYFPEFKVWFSTNHKPEIRGTDTAIWDRIRLVPFALRFYREDELTAEMRVRNDDARAAGLLEPYPLRDVTLPAKLRAELPGILNWALDGCRDWLAHGLGMPAEVQDATRAYRAEMDLLAHFLEDCCSEHKHAFIAAADLYSAYRTWTEDNGERPETQTAFGRRLHERGFTDGKQGGKRGWFGIGLVTQEVQEPFGHV